MHVFRQLQKYCLFPILSVHGIFSPPSTILIFNYDVVFFYFNLFGNTKKLKSSGGHGINELSKVFRRPLNLPENLKF